MIRLDAFANAPEAFIEETDEDLLDAFRTRLGDAQISSDEIAYLRTACGGATPAQLAPDAARRLLRDYRAGNTTRADSTDPHAWKNGAVACACTVKRDANGVLKPTDDCSCYRINGVRVDEHGDPKLNIETAENPNNRNRNMTHKRTDATDDNLVPKARAARDAKLATIWREQPPNPGASATTTRTDGADADDPVAAARRRRDEVAANAWKTSNGGA